MEIIATFPLVLYSYHLLESHRSGFDRYFGPLSQALGIFNPFRFLMSILIQPLSGIEYLSHYQEAYPSLQKKYGSYFEMYGSETLASGLKRITTSMASWKLLLFQSYWLKNEGASLLNGQGPSTLDLDASSLISFAKLKEGASVGHNKKYKGKPCFQLSASLIGKVFVDAKLFPGHCNPKSFFRKAVKRALALGLYFQAVRADSAYFSLENLRCLNKLSLDYAIGMASTFKVVKQGKAQFKQLARKKSRKIVSLRKGVSLLDLGKIALSEKEETRVLIVRRIQRRKCKKNGKWKVKTYFYAIATSYDWSPRKVFEFYHQRQGIESGFRELKDHYHLQRLPVKNLKGNEFWIICKILAMTLVKLFQLHMLPKQWRTLMRATLIRKLFQHQLDFDGKKLQISPKARHLWLLRRLREKFKRIEGLAIL